MVTIEKLPQEISDLHKIIKDLALRNQQLEEMVRFLRGERFGPSSEKFSDNQLRLFELDSEDNQVQEKEDEVTIESHTRKKKGRKKLTVSVIMINAILIFLCSSDCI